MAQEEEKMMELFFGVVNFENSALRILDFCVVSCGNAEGL